MCSIAAAVLLPLLLLPFLTPGYADCGLSEYFLSTQANQPDFKISNGDRVVSDAKYPWVAAFLRNDGQCSCQVLFDQNFCFCCTASIVGAKHILLAAHCFFSDQKQRVLTEQEALAHSQLRLGSVKLTSPRAIAPAIRRILVHPEFNRLNMSNDVAIIELASPLAFSPQIRAICLAREFNESAKLMEQEREGAMNNTYTPEGGEWGAVTIAGWGRQHEAVYDEESGELPEEREPDEQPELLREGRAHLVSGEECRRQSGKYGEAVTGKNICLGIGRQNAEPGDSGGPSFLRVEGNSSFVQIGLTSFSAPHNSNEPRHPVVYTRISAFCDWIGESTQREVQCL